jgi:hypothetical protein
VSVLYQAVGHDQNSADSKVEEGVVFEQEQTYGLVVNLHCILERLHPVDTQTEAEARK